MFILKNVYIEEALNLSDILIEGDRIKSIIPAGSISTNIPSFDGHGNVAFPSFVDSHVHLDKAFLVEKKEYQDNFIEKVRVTKSLKKFFTIDDIKERALKAIKMEISHGVGRIRANVDIDPVVGTLCLEGLLELKKEYRHLIDIQVGAFAQEGLFQYIGTVDLLRKAMELGADFLGGHTGVDKNPDEHINTMLKLAKEYKVDVEFHVDESGKPEDFWLIELAKKVIKVGCEGKVNAIHCCSLASVNSTIVNEAIKLVHDASINVIVCPSVVGPIRNITKVSELVEAGVNVSMGLDNIQDIFYPLGNGNLMLSCYLLTAVNRIFSGQAHKKLYHLITYNGARVFRVNDYGIKEGNIADIVILQGKSFWDALLKQCPIKALFKRGKLYCLKDE